jgi:hypothetical protein
MEKSQKINIKGKDKTRDRDWKRKESWEQDKMILESQLYEMPGLNNMGNLCPDLFEVKNKVGRSSKHKAQVHWKTQKKKKKKINNSCS